MLMVSQRGKSEGSEEEREFEREMATVQFLQKHPVTKKHRPEESASFKKYSNWKVRRRCST